MIKREHNLWTTQNLGVVMQQQNLGVVLEYEFEIVKLLLLLEYALD